MQRRKSVRSVKNESSNVGRDSSMVCGYVNAFKSNMLAGIQSRPTPLRVTILMKMRYGDCVDNEAVILTS